MGHNNESRRSFLKKSIIGASLALGAAIMPNGVMAAPASKKHKKAKTKRVLMIALDGICVEGFEKASTPNLDALLSKGALSKTTRVVMPSVTQPNWMSHLSGSGPEQHGVDANGWTLTNHKLDPVDADPDGYYPTIFKVLKDGVPNMKTAFYYNWGPLINPYNQRYIDEVSFEDDDKYLGNYAKAIEFMKRNVNDPTAIFLYSVHTDHAGHEHAWMSPEYIASIEEADKNIGDLLEKMESEGLTDGAHIMFISDHGGINHGYGGMSPQEMIVPWGITGPGIKKGFTIEEPNNTVNTAAVVAALFGVEKPLCWTGEIPESIFK